MHYHQRNTNDYARLAGHLTFIEHGALTLITDWIFSHRRPLPAEKDEIFRQIRPRNSSEKTTLLKVLEEFFTLTSSGWITEKIAEEIADYEEKSEKARKSALLRWEKERNADALRTHSAGTADGMLRARVPSTSNQEPVTNLAADKPPEGEQLNLESPPDADTLAQVEDPPVKKKKGAAEPPKPRARNELFDAIAGVCGIAEVTKSAGGRIAKALKEIKEATPEVTVEEIEARARRYREQWPNAELSPTALSANWGRFAVVKKERGAVNGVGSASGPPCAEWAQFARDELGWELPQGVSDWNQVPQARRSELTKAWNERNQLP